ncbi:MAG: sensor histidine kinase [Terracidiphilus sp.]
MQQLEKTAGNDQTDLKPLDAVMQTLVNLDCTGESLAELAHDARNMVTALGLYCDMLEEPGVLTTPFHHYGSELKLVAAASRRLVDKLAALDNRDAPSATSSQSNMLQSGSLSWMESIPSPSRAARHWDLTPAMPVDNLAEELRANRNLLSALAGPAISLTVDTERGALPVGLTGEELTRILVNLVKNAVEAMPAGGRIQIALRESLAAPGADPWLTLNIEDNGPGIPREALGSIFEAGYTTRMKADAANGQGGWRSAHRGLGLCIVRSIVETAGGRIHAANRDPSGSCFQIELPVRSS